MWLARLRFDFAALDRVHEDDRKKLMCGTKMEAHQVSFSIILPQI